MNLPPYLVDPPSTRDPHADPADERPPAFAGQPSHGIRHIKIAVALIVVALVAATLGAMGTRAVASPSHRTSTTSATTVSQRVGKVGLTETVGSWRVVVVNWGIGAVPRGSTNNQLIAWITFTNSAREALTWSAPDQVALRYLASDGLRERAYIKSSDVSGRDALRIYPGGSATVQYIWRLPIDANEFVLLFRPDEQSPSAAQVSLACC